MTKFYKKQTLLGLFSPYINDPEYPNVVIDISFEDDNILYKLYNNDNLKLDFKLDYNIVKNNSKFHDQTAWGFTRECFTKIASSTQSGSQYNVIDSDLVQIFSKTISIKPPVLSIINGEIIFAAEFLFFVPSLSSTINDIIIDLPYIKNEDGTPQVSYTFNGQELSPEVTITSLREHIDSITITTDKDNVNINEGDILNVTVTSADPTVKFIYVEEKFGKVSKTAIRLNNGVGTFTVDTEDLLSGDTVEFKVGYKYFTGVSSFKKQIS